MKAYSTEDLWETTLYLRPRPKQSVQGGSGGFFVPEAIKYYCSKLQGLLAKERPPVPFDGMLEMEVIFVFPFKKSAREADKEREWYFKNTTPDLDNLEKAVCDALEKSGILKNDSRICKKISTKLCILGEEGSITIQLRRLSYC